MKKVNQNKNNVFVSVIIPCYQEEKFIKKCLFSLVKNDYPKEYLEILVMDGRSTDKTRDIVREISNKYPFIRLIDNEKRYQSFALNKGIKISRGEIIIRCDAHATYSKNYIKKSVEWLLKDKKIGNVGGIWINKPANKSLTAKAIVYTLSHPFCVGPNKYRIGAKESKEVDTVPFGAWRKEIFDKVGNFREDFIRAQDLEFNIRLKKAGYKIILDPSIKIFYYPRDSFKKLFKMMVQYGYWKVIVNKETKTLSSLRQLVPPLFLLYLFFAIFFSFLKWWILLIPLFLYILIVLFFSLLISFKTRDKRIVPFCALVFLVTHFGYGFGYLQALFDIFLKKNAKIKYIEINR